MDFTIWKVEVGRNLTRGPWYSYSLRAYKDQPVIVLDESRFMALFPEIDTKTIPEAPKTTILSVDVRIISEH